MENAVDLTQSLGKLVHDYNARERQLIEEMRIGNKGQAVNLEFEDLEEYEVPPRTQFSMLKKAAVTFKYKEMMFNMAAIRLFEGTKFILPIVNRNKKRLPFPLKLPPEGEWEKFDICLKISEGLNDVEKGRIISGDQAFEKLRNRLDELISKKRLFESPEE